MVLTLHVQSLSHYHLLQRGAFVTTDEPTLVHTLLSPQILITLRFIFGGVYSIVLDKFIMTCTYHYTTIQNSFIVLKILCSCLFIPSFPFPSSLRSQRPGLSLHPCSPRVVSFLHCRTPEKCSGYRTGTCGRPQSCPQMSTVLGGAEAVRFGLGEDTLGSRLCVQLMEGSKRLGLGHF